MPVVDDGASFADIVNFPGQVSEPAQNFAFVAPFRHDPTTSDRIWFGGLKAWRSENAVTASSPLSVQWVQASTTLAGSGPISAWAVDPNNPDIRRREATLTFRPSDRADIYEATASESPLDGGVMSWARIDGNTLSIYQMTLNDTGGYELTSYDRTLTGTGMELAFRRLRDGDEVRTVTARLIKISG